MCSLGILAWQGQGSLQVPGTLSWSGGVPPSAAPGLGAAEEPQPLGRPISRLRSLPRRWKRFLAEILA